LDNQTLASQITDSAASLESAAIALGDKAVWSPLDKGRSAVSQLVECGGIMMLSAQILREKACPPLDRAAMQAAQAENDTLDKAVGVLQAGRDALVAALGETPASEIASVVVTLPFGGGMDKTLSEVVGLCYWNNSYHEGQINYIQTLAAE